MTEWADNTDQAIDQLLDREIKRIFATNGPFLARKIVWALKNFRTVYQFKIAEKLEPIKPRLLQSIENDILNNQDHFFGVLAEIEAVLSYVFTWPEIDELLNKHKSLIVKILLYKCKNFYRKADIIPYIETLRSIGMNWSELAVIEKSVKSDLQESERTAVTPQERYVIDHLVAGLFYRAILSLYTWPTASKPIQMAIVRQRSKLLWYLVECITKKNFSTFFRGIHALKIQQILWPELDELVASSKTPFIHQLLTKLKNHQDSSDLLYIEAVIRDAKRIVDWPELTLIRQESDGELYRARDQGTPGYEPDPMDDDILNG